MGLAQRIIFESSIKDKKRFLESLKFNDFEDDKYVLSGKDFEIEIFIEDYASISIVLEII